MRNMKRGLALTLAGTLMLNATAFAATPALSVQDKGEALYKLGLVQGYSDTEMVLGLDKEVTREVGVKLVLSMLGYTSSDIDMKATPSFKDVPKNHWSAPYIAFAEDKGITSGVSATQFGLGEKVTVRQITAFVLRALGYGSSETWTKGAELGLEAGIIDSKDIVKFDGTALRADFTDIAYDALSADKVNGQKLIDALVEDGAIKASVAEKLGLYTINKDLAVKSIETLNLKQFVVKFTAPVEEKSAIDSKNYSSKKFDVRNATYQLINDTTVLVSLDDKDVAEQQESGSITVEDVKSRDGKETIKEFTDDVQFFDAEFPKVDNVEVVGKDTIRVTFTEPMNTGKLSSSGKKAPFTLKDSDNKKYYVDDVTFEENNKVALVSFYKDFKEDEYTLNIEPGYKDYAGYTIIGYNENIDVEKDSEAPYIVDVKEVTPSKVTLIFNETLAELPKKEEVYHTNTNNKAESVKWGANHNELVVDFGAKNTMPETTYVYVKAEAIKDLWDNDNDTTLKYSFDVENDDVKPVLEKVKLGDSQNKLVLTFSEDVDAKTISKKDFVLKDEDGKELKYFISSSGIDVDGKEVTLKLKEAIKTGDFTLEVEKIDDMYGNTMESVEFEFSAEDVTAPLFPGETGSKGSVTLYDTNSDEQILVIDFGEKMNLSDDKYGVLNKENYRVEVQKKVNNTWKTKELYNLDDIEDAEIRESNNGKAVEIILDQRDGYRFVTGSAGKLYIGRVEDEAGNATKALSSGAINYAETADTIGLDTDKDKGFNIISDREAKLFLSESISDFESDDFRFMAVTVDGSGNATKVADLDANNIEADLTDNTDKPELTIVADKDMYRFTASGDVEQKQSNGSWKTLGKLKIYTRAQKDVETENQYGKKVMLSNVAGDKFLPTVAYKANSDEDYAIRAELVKKTEDGTVTYNPVIEIDFTEDIVNSAYLGHDFDIEVNGDSLLAGRDFTTSASGKTVTITVESKTEYKDYNELDIEVSLKDDVNYLRDAAGNSAKGGVGMSTTAKLKTVNVDQDAANTVITEINALPSTITLTNKKAVEDARASYNALKPAAKGLVTNLSTLTTAETTITTLTKAATDVKAQITALPATITLANETAVNDARTAYNALSTEQKALVDNESTLAAAETEISRLKGEAADTDAVAKSKTDLTVNYDGKAPTVTLDMAGSQAGVTVTWAVKTDATGVASLVGDTLTLTASDVDNVDDTVVLTATLKKGSAIETKDITLTVNETKTPVATITTGSISLTVDEALYMNDTALKTDGTITLGDLTAALTDAKNLVKSINYDGTILELVTDPGTADNDKIIIDLTKLTDKNGNQLSGTYTLTYVGSTWTATLS